MRGNRIPGRRLRVQAILLRHVVAEYKWLNRKYFDNRLRFPLFRLNESTELFGKWIGADRCIELSEQLTLERGWLALVEVLKQQMVHQFLDEVQKLPHQPPFGSAFRQVCEERGIDFAAEFFGYRPAGKYRRARQQQHDQHKRTPAPSVLIRYHGRFPGSGFDLHSNCIGRSSHARNFSPWLVSYGSRRRGPC